MSPRSSRQIPPDFLVVGRRSARHVRPSHRPRLQIVPVGERHKGTRVAHVEVVVRVDVMGEDQSTLGLSVIPAGVGLIGVLDVRGLMALSRHCPAIAQSRAPDCLSMRRSTYHSSTISTSVSVFSKGSSGSHRSESLVEIWASLNETALAVIVQSVPMTFYRRHDLLESSQRLRMDFI